MTDLSLPPSVTVSPTIVGVSVLTDDGATVQISLPRPLWFLYYFVRLGRLAIKAVRRTRAL